MCLLELYAELWWAGIMLTGVLHKSTISVITQQSLQLPLGKKPTIQLLTTMLSTSKNILFPGHNHLLTTGADEPTLLLSSEHHDIFRGGWHG